MSKHSVAALKDAGPKQYGYVDDVCLSADKLMFAVTRGTAERGAEANRCALETLETNWNAQRPDLSDHTVVRDWLQHSIKNANEQVWKAVRGEGFSTILTGVLTDNIVHMAHVGTSRAYTLKQGSLTALTEEHTLMNLMIKMGKFTIVDDAYASIDENGVAHKCSPGRVFFGPAPQRVLGSEEAVLIDSVEAALDPADWLILCTSGLWSYLSEVRISLTLGECETADEACERLTAAAREASSTTDIAIIALRYGDAPDNA